MCGDYFTNDSGLSQGGKQAVALSLDHGIALAGPCFESRPIQYDDDATAAVVNQTGLLQVSGGLGNTLATYTQHVGG